MAGELMEKYIVERIESLEEEVQEVRVINSFLECDLKAALKMMEIDADGNVIRMNIYEKYEPEQYYTLKRILKKYGMWKEVEPCEQEGVDSDTSQETAATSEG